MPHGPFRGVPMLLKDALCQTAGDPYYGGMRALRDRDWRAHEDSTWRHGSGRPVSSSAAGRTFPSWPPV